MDHPVQDRRLNQVLTNKKKRTCHILKIAVSAEHKLEEKEGEKLDKYLDLAKELKKLWNIMVTVIPIIVGGLRTVPKNLEKKLSEQKQKKKNNCYHPA